MTTLVEGLARDLGEHVDGLDYSTTSAANVFEEEFGSEPDLAAMVASSGGPEARLQRAGEGPLSNEQTVQIMFRAPPEQAHLARDLAWAAFRHLHGVTNHPLPGGVNLVWALMVQGAPVRIGADENGRQRYVLNARCEVTDTV